MYYVHFFFLSAILFSYKLFFICESSFCIFRSWNRCIYNSSYCSFIWSYIYLFKPSNPFCKENCKNNKNSPNFIASVLCSTIVNLQRNGLDSSLLKHEEISNTFDLLNSNKISKESVEIIFEQIMSGKAISASEAVKNASIRNMSEDELNKILDMIILNNSDKIQQDGIRSLTSLMGIAMKQVRGQASGNLVNTLLLRKINKLLEK